MHRRIVIGLLIMALAGCGAAQRTAAPDRSDDAPTNPLPSDVPTEQSANVIATAATASGSPAGSATPDLATLIWRDGDLAGITAKSLNDGASTPGAYGVQLMRGDEPIGAIAGMTLPSAAAAQAQVEEMQKASQQLGSTATRVTDLGDLAYSLDGESAQIVMSRCNVVVQILVASTLSAERTPIALAIDERLKTACAGS